MRRLLRYLADSSLRGVSVTEKRIASAVLMKDNFDPQIDSLVRKEMSRLRDKPRYYLSGALQARSESKRRDGYAVVFREIVAEQRAPTSCWLVLPFRSLPELNEVADRMLDEINIELDREGCVELIAPTTALAYRAAPGMCASSQPNVPPITWWRAVSECAREPPKSASGWWRRRRESPFSRSG